MTRMAGSRAANKVSSERIFIIVMTVKQIGWQDYREDRGECLIDILDKHLYFLGENQIGIDCDDLFVSWVEG